MSVSRKHKVVVELTFDHPINSRQASNAARYHLKSLPMMGVGRRRFMVVAVKNFQRVVSAIKKDQPNES